MILWETPVLDRSQSDVDHAKQLWDIGYNNLTDTQKAEYIAGLKGSLNLSDLYRLQNNIQLLSDVLELGLDFKLGNNICPINSFSLNSPINHYLFKKIPIDVKPNNLYTLSFKVKILSGTTSKINVAFYNKNISICSERKDLTINNGFCVGTFMIPDNVLNYYYLLIYDGTWGGTKGNLIEFSDVQLEKGGIATSFQNYAADLPEILTEEKCNEIITDVEIIRNAYTKYDTTPSTPSFPLNDYKKFNDIEQILTDVYKILNSNFHYYTGQKLYSGRRIGLL